MTTTTTTYNDITITIKITITLTGESDPVPDLVHDVLREERQSGLEP